MPGLLKEGGSIKLLNKQELQQRIISEGTRYTTVIAVNNQEITPGSYALGAITPSTNFKDFYIEDIDISCNSDGQYTIEGGRLNDSGSTEFGLYFLKAGLNSIKYNYLARRDMYDIRIFGSPIDWLPSYYNAIPSLTSLVVTKSAITLISGNAYSYVVTVTNNGAATSGTVTIKDQMADAFVISSGTGANWTVTPNADSKSYVATTSTVIASSASVTYTITAFSTKKVRMFATVKGYLVDHDINYDAPGLVWCGTSITANSSPSSYKTSYTYLIRNHLRDDRNIITRVINRAISGTTSAYHEEARKFDNRYDLPELPWGAVWEHGINDQSQGVPLENTVANALAYVAHWRRLSPKIWVFIFAPYPNGNSPIETGLVARRVALKAAIQGLNDPYTKYFESMGTLFPISQEATYLTDKTHLNNAGNALVAQAFATEISGLNLKQIQ